MNDLKILFLLKLSYLNFVLMDMKRVYGNT